MAKVQVADNFGGFSFNGEAYEVKGKKGARYIDVPPEAVADAISHGGIATDGQDETDGQQGDGQ